MKYPQILLSVFLLLGLSPRIMAEDTVSVHPASMTADQAWEELRSLGLLELYPYPAHYAEEASVRRQMEMMEQLCAQLREKGLAFYEAFPSDPRRWSLVMRMASRVPRFIVSYHPDIDKRYEAAVATGDMNAPIRAKFAADREVVVDPAAAAVWQAKLAELTERMRTATDLPADVREMQDSRATADLIRALLAAAKSGQAMDWMKVREHLQAFTAKYPESDFPDSQLFATMFRFELTHPPAESAAVWRGFLDFPNQKLAGTARKKVLALELMRGPVELAFTALDGRGVDLKQLRGKVVLIDFWATWCGPCMAEMPNVKKVYAAYHDRGFEIIGVSCDYAPQAGTKSHLAKTGPEVLAFAQKQDMPWPQHYEGKKHGSGGNVLAERFGVFGIPAAFLLDQTGTVVATNLRGEQLEAEVKRLLKL